MKLNSGRLFAMRKMFRLGALAALSLMLITSLVACGDDNDHGTPPPTATVPAPTPTSTVAPLPTSTATNTAAVTPTATATPSPTSAGVTAHQVQQLLADTFNTVDTTQALWNIQPGLGTVMMEYGRRIAMVHQAVEAGDWGMAQYQLTEATEIQEVGETTRPANAALLKAFEQTYLDPMAQVILNKDTTSFNNNFPSDLNGCNGCHAGTGHPYVVVRAPATAPEDFLQLAASEPKTPAASNPFPTATPAADTTLSWADLEEMVDNAFNTVDRSLALWGIQPGLGTVMMEYGRRIALLKHAVDAGDWGMAQYQLTEATEIQEVGETTRPANAPLLKAFEQTYLDPLAQDILNKDTAKFATDFSSALGGCNGCHAGTGHPYVRVQMPPTSPQPFLLFAASEPKPPAATTPVPTATPTNTPVGAPALDDAQKLVQQRFNTVDRSLALWDIQPGLGTVMQEYGYRFALTWFAAEAGNWGMAAYQIKEATEIQEVGETTRPANAPLLKAFETTYLDPLNAAITAKDKTAFESAYNAAIGGCNGCHQATGHPYVRVQISPVEPVMPPDFLDLPAGAGK